MYPVLLTIGSFPVSSFGLFLALGIFFGSFTVWRIARSFDFEAEKVLDVIFLTVGFGFIFSRSVFVLTNLEIFDSFTKIFFINRYPGLSFWGGFLGGLLALKWLARKNKVSFPQVADIAIIGFFVAGFLAEMGCLLGACGIGLETTSLFSVDQVGVIGKRFPIQLIEALSFLFIFFLLWKKVLRFHIQGSLLSKGLMLLGAIKFIATFFKASNLSLKIGNIAFNLDLIFAGFVFLLGAYFHYKTYKKTPKSDLASILRFLTSRSMQKSLMSKVIRWCYNQKANFTVSLVRGKKKLFKLLNIRSNPGKF